MPDLITTPTRNDIASMHNAARLLAKRILPDSAAVAQFARLIRYTKPFVEEGQSAVDNVMLQHPVDEQQPITQLTTRTLALNTLGREHLSDFGTPPSITIAMLPKKRETDKDDENIKGLAELTADLGIAYVLVSVE
jgi:hypothetical protein